MPLEEPSMQAETWLPVVFAGLMALSMLIYAILDGFDLGVGVLMRFANSEDHDMMVASVGPFWDANETWLVLGVGLLLVAFPHAHGVILSTLYGPVAIMLLGLILRGVAFDFRAKAKTKYKKLWNNIFQLGSVLATAAQGYMLGQYIMGFDSGAGAVAFSVLSAICVTAGYTLMGGCWLVMKTSGKLQKQAIKWSQSACVLTLLGIILVSIVNPLLSDRIFAKWFTLPDALYVLPVPLLALGLLFWTFFLLRKLPLENDRFCWMPFTFSALVFLFSFIGLAFSFYPYIIPDSLTVWEAASAEASLRFIFYGVVVVLPAILLYTAFAYRVFWGKATQLTYE